jgi:hypothetical protein
MQDQFQAITKHDAAGSAARPGAASLISCTPLPRTLPVEIYARLPVRAMADRSPPIPPAFAVLRP